MTRALAYGAALALLAAVLAGCGGGQKVAAHVNGDLVTEDEFINRMENVTGPELYQSATSGGAMKAGEYALRQLIQEKLILQLAKEKKCEPTDAQINAYLAFSKAKPGLAGRIGSDTTLTDADRRRMIRAALAVNNLARAPLTITDADLQKAYDERKPQLEIPDRYHLRIIACITKQKSQEVLTALNKQVSFDAVAMRMSDDRQVGARGGDVGEIAGNDPRVPKEIMDAVKKLNPGQYTQQPVVFTPQGAPKPQYLIIQLVSKTPGRMPPLAEVRPYLELAAISEKDPAAGQRVEQTIRDFVSKANIQVSLKPYEDLGKKLKDEASKPMNPLGGPGGPAPAPAPGPAVP